MFCIFKGEWLTKQNDLCETIQIMGQLFKILITDTSLKQKCKIMKNSVS